MTPAARDLLSAIDDSPDGFDRRSAARHRNVLIEETVTLGNRIAHLEDAYRHERDAVEKLTDLLRAAEKRATEAEAKLAEAHGAMGDLRADVERWQTNTGVTEPSIIGDRLAEFARRLGKTLTEGVGDAITRVLAERDRLRADVERLTAKGPASGYTLGLAHGRADLGHAVRSAYEHAFREGAACQAVGAKLPSVAMEESFAAWWASHGGSGAPAPAKPASDLPPPEVDAAIEMFAAAVRWLDNARRNRSAARDPAAAREEVAAASEAREKRKEEMVAAIARTSPAPAKPPVGDATDEPAKVTMGDLYNAVDGIRWDDCEASARQAWQSAWNRKVAPVLDGWIIRARGCEAENRGWRECSGVASPLALERRLAKLTDDLAAEVRNHGQVMERIANALGAKGETVVDAAIRVAKERDAAQDELTRTNQRWWERDRELRDDILGGQNGEGIPDTARRVVRERDEARAGKQKAERERAEVITSLVTIDRRIHALRDEMDSAPVDSERAKLWHRLNDLLPIAVAQPARPRAQPVATCEPVAWAVIKPTGTGHARVPYIGAVREEIVDCCDDGEEPVALVTAPSAPSLPGQGMAERLAEATNRAVDDIEGVVSDSWGRMQAKHRAMLIEATRRALASLGAPPAPVALTAEMLAPSLRATYGNGMLEGPISLAPGNARENWMRVAQRVIDHLPAGVTLPPLDLDALAWARDLCAGETPHNPGPMAQRAVTAIDAISKGTLPEKMEKTDANH